MLNKSFHPDLDLLVSVVAALFAYFAGDDDEVEESDCPFEMFQESTIMYFLHFSTHFWRSLATHSLATP